MGRYSNSRWSNWDMLESENGAERLKKIFQDVIDRSGEVRIYTVLDQCSASGMSRHISAFVPVINVTPEGKEYADMCCIARERYVSGCGMDMGFHLAYSLYLGSGIDDDNKHPYQNCLRHSWL